MGEGFISKIKDWVTSADEEYADDYMDDEIERYEDEIEEPQEAEISLSQHRDIAGKREDFLEKELLFEMIPGEEMHLYTPRLSDLLKSKFNNEKFGEKKGEFLKLWVKTGIRKPMIYLNAWLMTSYGYWYPDAVINVYGGHGCYTFTYENSSYFGFETEYPGTRESKFPWLEEQYRKISLELFQQKVPAVSMLFSPGFLLWCFLFVLGYFLKNGQWNKILGVAGILLLWLTVILGPTYLVRYVLILWFAMPVVIAETKIK